MEAALAVVLIALCSLGYAAKGGDPGPPVGGESPNNLSLPSIQTQSSLTTDAYWNVPTEGVLLGDHYSYGCDKPEGNEQFSYPNTSCVDNIDSPNEYYDAAACTALGAPCEGYAVSRIYHQKVDVNEWWADDEGTTVWPLPVAAKFVDWGDALEAVSWNERSVIRVETQPYSSTLNDDPLTADLYEASLQVDEFGVMETCAEAAGLQGLDPLAACKTGFQMWHVSGQGITEHWGVRASDPEDDNAVSYNYDSPFQIIKSTNARLNLTKLVPGDAVCPEPGGNPNEGPPDIQTEWTGSGWTNTCNYYDAPYSVETSVGGKYVYGYNWRMKSVDLSLADCPLAQEDWVKTGYWRLTFYAPGDITFAAIDDSVLADEEMANMINKAPPVPAAEERVLVEEAPLFAAAAQLDMIPAAEAEDEDPDADDRLFRPVIDKANDLTYIDICIKAKATGGGGGNGGKGGGGRGGGDGGGKGSGKGGGK